MGLNGQRHAPAALPPGKIPGTHFIWDWLGPRAGLDGCGKSRLHRHSVTLDHTPFRSTYWSVHTCAYIHTFLQTCKHPYTYAYCIYIYIYIYIYICPIHLYTYVYHTHAQKNTYINVYFIYMPYTSIYVRVPHTCTEKHIHKCVLYIHALYIYIRTCTTHMHRKTHT